jgi:hypothetical protein
MKTIMTSHQNSDGFAKGLLPFVLTARKSTSCRPWNPWNAPETEWLLSPVREWPAYRPSKYFTEMDRAEEPVDSRLHVGIYAEKGYDGEARKAYPENQLMDASWGWHRVLDGFRLGAIPGILAGMPPMCRAQTMIRFGGGYGGPVDGDYTITINEGSETLLTTTVEDPCKEMAALAAVGSWKELVTALDTLASDGWLWVNFYVYLRLGLAPRDRKPDDEVWTDQQVWSRFLEPLLPWISEK